MREQKGGGRERREGGREVPKRGRGRRAEASTYQHNNWGISNKSNGSTQLPFVTSTAKERWSHAHSPNLQSCLPVGATALAGMLGEIHPTNLCLHHILDLLLWNPSQASIHGEQLVGSESFNQCIKLQSNHSMNESGISHQMEKLQVLKFCGIKNS